MTAQTAKLPDGLIKIRSDMCKACVTPCSLQNDIDKIGDKCSRCPIYKWDALDCIVAPPPMGHNVILEGQKFGLGDAVYKVANPIAIIIDRTTSVLPKNLQTNIQGCGGCKKRREQLNKLI